MQLWLSTSDQLSTRMRFFGCGHKLTLAWTTYGSQLRASLLREPS
jgi:hypothetical protein